MSEITKRFFAKLYLQQASSEDYVDWAIACLEDGLDTKNLRMLSAMQKPFYSSEIEEHFRRALSELGWTYPNQKDCLLSHAKELAEKITSGELNPMEGCNKISRMNSILDYPSELANWFYLDEGIDPESKEWIGEYPRIENKRWADAIIREAKKLVETNFS